jgi:hypothetical protein
VITQAITIPRATPHRTADVLRADPTPMIAPVIVCVVETGMPSHVAVEQHNPPSRTGAEALHGCQTGDLRAHGANKALYPCRLE